MGRVDYYDDPAAPKANSLVVAVSAIVADERGRLVLQKRADNSLWALPGGGVELGESVEDAIIRETREETGLMVSAKRIIAVYSDPKHVFAYENGEVRQEFSICIECETKGGQLEVSDESTDVDWFDIEDISDLPIHPRIRVRIDDYVAGVSAGLR